MTSPGAAPGGGLGARWRLRDLAGRDRLLAAAMFVLIVVPFAVALVRAFRDGWIPSGDEANIATRAFDVFSRHPPLTGLPSTSFEYGERIFTNHPGPIEFYLMAVPLRVLGISIGPLLTAVTINAAFVLIAVWAVFRRLGLTAMLWSGVLLLAVMWSAGTAVLTDTLSSNMTMYSLLCVAVLAWALVDGDLRLLPLSALVASYAAQQHLEAGLIVAALAVVAIGAVTFQVVRRARRGDAAVKKTALRLSGAAFSVAAVSWAPVGLDEVRGSNGNLTRIVRFARDSTRPTFGLKSGIQQTLHAVTPPTVLGRTDTTGDFFLQGIGSFRLILGILVVGALAAIAWRARVRMPALARLALVALILLVVGSINGSNVPHSLEATRVNLYRWTWAAAFLTWVTLGIGIVLLIDRTFGARPIAVRARRLGRPALLVVAALIATSVVFVSGSDDHNREVPEFRTEKRVVAALLDRIDRHRPVVVDDVGYDAHASIGPYVILRLLEAGVTVEVPSPWTIFYGMSRRYQPGSNPAAIVIVSGGAVLPPEPGELVMTEQFGPERAALLDSLSAAAVGTTVELAPGGRGLIDRQYSGLATLAIDDWIKHLSTNPRTALEQPAFLQLVLKGLLRSPVLDKAKVQRLLELPAGHFTVYGDQQVAVHVLSPEQLRKTGLP